MAEVQKLATSDIPIGNSSSNNSPAVENAADAVAAAAAAVNAANAADLGTSPTQERSSNSHPHDSEYDTASDLEGDTSDVDDGGEEYDEDDTDLDDETDEDDEDDIENEELEPLSGDGAESGDKAGEAEIQKKVDEDRSNPQYIPKRGTFYEHDDRMADGENDVVLQIGDAPSGAENVSKSGTAKASSQSPSISHASKTMKKFQPASASERWTHDRFDPSEQQPKSDAEIINQYGFNMRKEANPPRARRRRRYARGPNKYDRKWEDESAYIKPPNKERKPPRASDFPALNERAARRPRRSSRDYEDDRDRRDEKENRPERRRAAGMSGSSGKKSSVNDRLNLNAPRNSYGDERRDRDDGRNRSSGKSSVQSRLNVSSGRQPAMEFKQKNRNVRPSTSTQPNSHSQQNNGRSDERFDRQSQRYGQNQMNYGSSNDDQYQQNRGLKNVSHAKSNQGDVYNNNGNSSGSGSNQAQISNKMHEQHGYGQLQQHQLPTGMAPPQQQQSTQQSNLVQMRQPIPAKSTPTPSNLSQRLQQVQNRNDPSHVGSVQMHSLATQNQQQQQQQQQQQLVMNQQTSANAMLMSQQQQQQQQQLTAQSQEQRGPPKRYSSMRRSQHDTQHLPPDAHAHQQQLQQMHMQPPQPPPQNTPGAPAIMMQDQHSILQANLLQRLYHQENLQAQMQALQVSQTAPAPQPKQPSVYGANPANAAAYYVADAYGNSTANTQAPPTAGAPYAPQQPTYLPPAQANAATLAYASQPPPAPNTIASGPPPAVYAGPPQPAANTNQNFSNYQNYNTVGGTTYFVPPAPTTSRPVVLPQRRPTNAIPILPPAEKNKHRGNDSSKEDVSKLIPHAQMDAGENIDHIIDNMFVQRPAFQPPQAAVSSTVAAAEGAVSAGDAQTQLQAAASDLNTLANNATSSAGNPLPDTSSNTSSSSAPTNAEAASISNSNSTESSSNNNPISPQE